MTMEKIKALIDEKMQCFSTMKGLVEAQEKAKKEKLDPQEQEQFDKASQKYDELSVQAEALQKDLDNKHKLESYELDLKTVSRQAPFMRLADNAQKQAENESKKSFSECSDDEKYARQIDLFRKYLTFDADQRDRRFDEYDLRQGLPVAGGYVAAPTRWAVGLLEPLKKKVIMRQVANVLPPLAKKGSAAENTLAPMGPAKWSNELDIADFDQDMGFGEDVLYTHAMSGAIKASDDFLNHSREGVNPEALIDAEFIRIAAELEEIAFFLGDGFKKPLGLLTNSPYGIDSSRYYNLLHTSPTDIGLDNLIALEDLVHESFLPGAMYMVNRTTRTKMRLKKDSQGRYLYEPSLQAGVPDMFNGYPVRVTDSMPGTIVANAKVAVFGNFQEYRILDCSQVHFSRNDSLFWLKNQVAFKFRRFVGGKPHRKEAFAVSVMPAS